MEPVPPEPGVYAPLPRVQLREGTDPASIVFPSLGYAAAAAESWRLFQRLQSEGALPPGARFQVSLPTPLAPVIAFVVPESQAPVEAAYEQRLATELETILGLVPHDSLAIQWDVAVEMALWEGVWKAHFVPLKEGILERLARMGGRVPARVELGYHLCYGDFGHQHFKQPGDTANLVEVARGILDRVTRPVSWIHMPVPRSRTDEAYFRPLAKLRTPPGTELYLGLVHRTDGLEGARMRIAAASRVVPAFGIATECGMGRRPPESVRPLLELHAELCGPIGG